jgi:uncharacterized protein YciI
MARTTDSCGHRMTATSPSLWLDSQTRSEKGGTVPTFAVRTVHDRGWDDQRPMRQQDGWPEHATFMNALEEEGFVVLGGPLGANGTHTGALLIVEAASEDQVIARLKEDPWARLNVLAIETVDTITILLDRRGATVDQPAG